MKDDVAAKIAAVRSRHNDMNDEVVFLTTMAGTGRQTRPGFCDMANTPMFRPDLDQIEIFTDALFRHARREGFV